MTESHAFLPHWTGHRLHAAHLLSQPCPGSWQFVAHECQPRCDGGSEHCSWFPQFFIPSQSSCLLFSHRLTEVITCIPYISPGLRRQCHEFRHMHTSTPAVAAQHTSGTARIPSSPRLPLMRFLSLQLRFSLRPRGSSVHAIFQATVLEWAAISFPRGSSLTEDQTHISCIGRQIL